MAEIKDKIVTVESLKSKHDYDESTYLKKSGALTTLGVTATATELNYVDGVTSNVQTQLNAKLPLAGGTITGNLAVNGTSNLKSDVTFGDRAIFSNSNRGIVGTDTSGNIYHQFQPVNASNNCAIGYGLYDAGLGSTDIYGNIVTINSKNAVGINATKINLNNPVYMPNETSIYGTTTSGGYKNVFTPVSAAGNTAIGYDNYQNSSGNTNIYGDNICIWSNEANLSASPYGVNQVLWSGTSYVESGKTLSLSKNISTMPHGISLVFSAYTVGTGATDTYWHTFFVPKYMIGADNAGGYAFTMMKGGKFYMKYLYINDAEIYGAADNNNSSFSLHGQTVDNRNFVLRYVIGV